MIVRNKKLSQYLKILYVSIIPQLQNARMKRSVMTYLDDTWN